jgi:spermidine/putrescine ABC transporter ATP-binding subunit
MFSHVDTGRTAPPFAAITEAAMSSVELRHVFKSFGGMLAVDDVNLNVGEGEFVVLLGPSGCGKTTTLRMVAGFEMPTKGQILFGGQDMTAVPARSREIGMVFQNYALFPNMTVAENIGFGLRQRKASREVIAARVDEMLALAQLEALRDRYPTELSGGQQQRVALTRALAVSPRLLLMDEPLGALDLKLREAMQVELKQLQRRFGITTILVTHDQQEAMSLADRIVIMEAGRIRQSGSPEDLYDNPNSRFVAEFVGKNNILKGVVSGADANGLAIRLNGSSPATEIIAARMEGASWVRGDAVLVGLRPEHMALSRPDDRSSANNIPGRILGRQFLGNIVHYFVELPWAQTMVVEHSSKVSQFQLGAEVSVHFQPEHCRPLAAGGAGDA